MKIAEQLEQDLIKALKERREEIVSVLRMLKSVIKNKEIEKKGKLNDEDILDIIGKEAKKRKESAQAFKDGGRNDLAEKELRENDILTKYLPEQISEDELRKIVKEVVSKMGANSPADMGKVMSQVMPQTKGRADGAMISRIVKEELNK